MVMVNTVSLIVTWTGRRLLLRWGSFYVVIQKYVTFCSSLRGTRKSFPFGVLLRVLTGSKKGSVKERCLVFLPWIRVVTIITGLLRF